MEAQKKVVCLSPDIFSFPAHFCSNMHWPLPFLGYVIDKVDFSNLKKKFQIFGRIKLDEGDIVKQPAFYVYIRKLSRNWGQFSSTALVVLSNIWHKKCLVILFLCDEKPGISYLSILTLSTMQSFCAYTIGEINFGLPKKQNISMFFASFLYCSRCFSIVIDLSRS